MNMDNKQFISLVARHQGGEKRATNELFLFLHATGERVFHASDYHLSMDWDDVEHFVSDKCQYLMKYDYTNFGAKTPKTWLKGVFNNLFRDAYRKIKHRKEDSESRLTSFIVNDDDCDEKTNDIFGDLISDYTADGSLLNKELSKVLKQAMSMLCERQRNVLDCFFFQGMGTQEVMEVLRLREDQVNTAKHVGLKRMRMLIEKNFRR
jgi:RNA polymerase sigma factor (sigma-70 family)